MTQLCHSVINFCVAHRSTRQRGTLRPRLRSHEASIGFGPGLNVFLQPSCQSPSGGRDIMSKRILVVEDQEDNRQILRDLLTSVGYELIQAEHGEEALASAARERPDLILMDIQLPLLDGYEVTRRIKADPALRAIPIIAITS